MAEAHSPIQDHADYEDYLLAFFQNCWHLRDWVKNDTTIPQNARTSIGQAAERSHILKLCYDLATRSKHLQLRKPQRDGRLIGDIGIRLHDSTSGETDFAIIRSYYVIDDSGRTVSALVLARRAVHKWRQIMRKNGLTLPRN